ncbi:MAG: hypothetical protein GY749_08685 [Desulfobacteraceae bacterium]|nr:hypothetical protein [Desulfobacteraceae bacterium]
MKAIQSEFLAKCSKCQKEIKAGDEYNHHLKKLCEDCYADICMPRVRKTHWQYLKSIKTDGWQLAGAFSVAGQFVQAIGRLRCLVQGCCHGRELSQAGSSVS